MKHRHRSILPPLAHPAVLLVGFALSTPLHARVIVRGEIVERNGMVRRASVLEQGIPVSPMGEDEVRNLVIAGPDGRPLPGSVEAEAHDQNGKVNWLRLTARVAMPANTRLPVRIQTQAPAEAAGFALRTENSKISVEAPGYRLAVDGAGHIELVSHGKRLLSGRWDVELQGDARAILWGAEFRQLAHTGAWIEEQTRFRATLLMKAYLPVNQRKEPGVLDPGRRMDFELRLFVNAFTPNIRFAWRVTNQLGHKTWLRRFALSLPLAGGAGLLPSARPDAALLDIAGGRLAVTADFFEDLGRGAGILLAQGRRSLLLGGIQMPADGGYATGKAPDIHRLFHDGMSRTFSGTLIPGGTASAAAEALAPLDLVVAPQYYSDVQALPESGDPVTFGEFGAPVHRAAEWLLNHQWRGTLWWGEWYREWDETRGEGVQEASNGNSPLAPLYHYWRTGDARFLRCAERSAQYVWDVQISRGSNHQLGWMFHTRRHLFDELDWIHPRYQRATGGLLASHVFLNPAARRDIIQTIRNFHEKYFDLNGAPHDWDKLRNQRGTGEDGVDTSNFMEALAYCYRETGDRYFLDAALKMSRWTAGRYKIRGTRKWDDWNWNLTQYALRGLYHLYLVSQDQQVYNLMADMMRKTLANKSAKGSELKDGIGGGEAHFVFYHAWISTRVAALCPDRAALAEDLMSVVRREVARVRQDGLIPYEPGFGGGMPTTWTSYYDAKALVAYVPVITARLTALIHSRTTTSTKDSSASASKTLRSPGASP